MANNSSEEYSEKRNPSSAAESLEGSSVSSSTSSSVSATPAPSIHPERADGPDLLIDIPVALLDQVDLGASGGESALPTLQRSRTNPAGAAALRIKHPFLSPLNGESSKETFSKHRKRRSSLPSFPVKAFMSEKQSQPPSPNERDTLYDHLRNYSLASSASSPFNDDPFSGDEISPVEPAVHTGPHPHPYSITPGGGLLKHSPSTASRFRRSSVHGMWEKAKSKKAKLERGKWSMIAFEYSCYAFLALCIYFILIGRPLWQGLTWYMWLVVSQKFALTAGVAIFVGIAVFYAFAPLLIFFEDKVDDVETRDVSETALIIPCYKAASIIEATLVAAKKVFPARQIFVIANGNSPTPLDETEDICKVHGVNHIWVPVGSKIVAQFAGCYVTKSFKYVLLIDDDCALPPDFPVVTHRMTDAVKCIGYTIKSVGPDSSRGTIVQQAQDLEYKLSGIQREFAGKMGSATFPHGAISIWDREFLAEAFKYHPGFSVSEDWFLGHVARLRGSRILMCSQVFIETETPTNIFVAAGSRGGFGEMTVWKQRFHRWNFFFVSGIWYDMEYIICSWKLGWWEFGAKIFVWQEVYETLLYLLTPFILPISFMVRPWFALWTFIGVIGLYAVHAAIFNAIHLRRKKEMVPWMAVLYCVPYKLILTFINVTSCYWAIFKYAQYFAKPHPKVIEDEKSVEVVMRISESQIFGGSVYGNPSSQSWTEKSDVYSIGSERIHSPSPVLKEPVPPLQGPKY